MISLRPLLILVFCAILISCSEPLQFNERYLTEKDLSLCKNATCPEMQISYVRVYNEDEIADRINNKIEEHIINVLSLDDMPDNSKMNIEDAMYNFVEQYRLDSAEFPGMSAAYSAEIEVVQTAVFDQILSFKMSSFLYTGGAHGMSGVKYLNFDPSSGELFTNEQLFTNTEAFIEIAEEAFRKKHSISETASINSTGFWFKNETFVLPESIGFSSENVLLHYNQYEIAPYAMGPIEVELPIKELEHLLLLKIK